MPPTAPRFVVAEVPQALSQSHQGNDGWLALIKQCVYVNHPRVEDVYVSIGDEGLVDYWIVIPTRDVALVRRLIEDQQQNIIRLFARTPNPPFQLDFHIIYREGREVSDLVPSGAIRIPRL